MLVPSFNINPVISDLSSQFHKRKTTLVTYALLNVLIHFSTVLNYNHILCNQF